MVSTMFQWVLEAEEEWQTWHEHDDNKRLVSHILRDNNLEPISGH